MWEERPQYARYNEIITVDKSESKIGFPVLSWVPYFKIIFSLPYSRFVSPCSARSSMLNAVSIGNFPTLLFLRLCFVLFSPTTGVTCPGPVLWFISRDLTPDLILGLGRWQVFLVICFCANEVGLQFNDIKINLPEFRAEAQLWFESYMTTELYI